MWNLTWYSHQKEEKSWTQCQKNKSSTQSNIKKQKFRNYLKKNINATDFEEIKEEKAKVTWATYITCAHCVLEHSLNLIIMPQTAHSSPPH